MGVKVSGDVKAVTLVLLWSALGALGTLAYATFFEKLFHAWLHNEEYSFGILIPFLVAFPIWARRKKVRIAEESRWLPGLILVVAGCVLQVFASRGGTLLLSGIAFVMTVSGIVGYLWGKKRLVLIMGPLALLILMVPLPSYVVGQVSWYLQSAASTASGSVLGFLGVPVYQDGNLLRLSHYVLEVKQACSGSRSILALFALAWALGMNMDSKYWVRVLLLLVTPILALGANVIRIVGTGLIASEWGGLAANESLHTIWGVIVFLIAVFGLVGIQTLLRRAVCKSA